MTPKKNTNSLKKWLQKFIHDQLRYRSWKRVILFSTASAVSPAFDLNIMPITFRLTPCARSHNILSNSKFFQELKWVIQAGLLLVVYSFASNPISSCFFNFVHRKMILPVFNFLTFSLHPQIAHVFRTEPYFWCIFKHWLKVLGNSSKHGVTHLSDGKSPQAILLPYPTCPIESHLPLSVSKIQPKLQTNIQIKILSSGSILEFNYV